MKTTTMLRTLVQMLPVLALSAGLTGCLSVKSYVDPALPVLARTQLPAVAQPKPVTILFEFATKGNANVRATSELRGRVVAAVAESGMFTTISPVAGSAETGLLKIAINNVAEDQNAVAKGVGTGLTFGLAGSLVTDGYVCTASYSAGGRSAESTVRHALLSTIGNRTAPQGLTPKTPADAINQIVEQLVWHSLKNLAEQNAFTE